MILQCVYVLFFFFKQKTAYEVRISDWSSDVCSSDLRRDPADSPAVGPVRPPRPKNARASGRDLLPLDRNQSAQVGDVQHSPDGGAAAPKAKVAAVAFGRTRRHGKNLERGHVDRVDVRSEEHTSELQSLMRNSYAVFGLKKK